MRTSKADFETFKTSCIDWQSKLGLIEWALYFEHANLPDEYAKTSWSTGAMVATIQFSTHWDNLREKTAQEIHKLALHEILHILMAPFVSEAEYRFSTSNAIETAEHSIIRRLENILWK